MTELRRLDRLTAGRVEVAIVFKEMLGDDDAAAYMAQNGIPQHVADRVLAGMTTTRTSDGAIVGYCQHDQDVHHSASAVFAGLGMWEVERKDGAGAGNHMDGNPCALIMNLIRKNLRLEAAPWAPAIGQSSTKEGVKS